MKELSRWLTELPFLLDFERKNVGGRIEKSVFVLGFRPERKMVYVNLPIARRELVAMNAEMAEMWGRSCFWNTITKPAGMATIFHGEINGKKFIVMPNVTSTYGILAIDMNRYALLRWAEANAARK